MFKFQAIHRRISSLATWLLTSIYRYCISFITGKNGNCCSHSQESKHLLPVPAFGEWIFSFPSRTRILNGFISFPSHSRTLEMELYIPIPAPELVKVIPAHPWFIGLNKNRCITKHCQRHNGPEGWVHITRSQFTVHKSWTITISEFRLSINKKSQPNISNSTKSKVKILTKPSFKILTKIQLRYLNQTSAAKYWPNFSFKISPELQLQNVDLSAQSLNKS